MKDYQHILVALDFSASQEAVLNKSLILSRLFDSQLSLVHVVECTDLAYAGDMIMPADPSICEELSEQAKKRLQHIKETEGFSTASTMVHVGIPKHEITRLAKEIKADLIVIGSHGRHGLQLLLGSTANGVLHLADCDVLAVRVRS